MNQEQNTSENQAELPEQREKIVYSNLGIIWQNLAKFYTGVLGILVLVAVGFLGFFIANKLQTLTEQDYQTAQRVLADREQNLFELNQQLNFLRVELEVEKVANQKIQQSLNELTKENTELKKELAFFQNVMAPEKYAEGIMVEEFDVIPTSSANRFRYRVVLVQTRKEKRFAKGNIQIQLYGQQQDKVTRYDMKDLELDKKANFKFSFKYFQVIEGEFEIDPVFKPERVQVSTIIPKTRWQKYNKVDAEFNWKLNSDS
ncbi:hypothetical protein HR060_16185 [Catenovulum sp. SM1970]|uniref:DUF6776 family protein n=1 Tax=Marinifaba aquimaris TaxID=2741323 RepID=UPI0015730F87|nr:DUF6776 family protein [Marinifaba aquimaris]NTS78392.1 hypothetical protein [Marinifaba aquimaris]